MLMVIRDSISVRSCVGNRYEKLKAFYDAVYADKLLLLIKCVDERISCTV